MSLSAAHLDNQKRLKLELQGETKASKLENLAAALIGRLLGVPVAVAKAGFQHGGDAGPAGQQERRFRLERKKYSDTTSFDNRELLGENGGEIVAEFRGDIIQGKPSTGPAYYVDGSLIVSEIISVGHGQC